MSDPGESLKTVNLALIGAALIVLALIAWLAVIHSL